MKLSITLEVGEYNGTMGMQISNNNQTIYSIDKDTLSAGTHTIDLDIDTGSVEFIGFGKNYNDTLVDQNQNVIKDKYIDILSLSIDLLELKKFYLCHSKHFFETYFSKNEIKKFSVPSKQNLLTWYMQILEDHKNNEH